MSATLAEFLGRTTGTWLEGRRTIAIDLPATSEQAFAVELAGDELATFWPLAADLAQVTGRPPVAVQTMASGNPDWLSAIRDENFFNRFEYSQQPGGGDPAPAAIVQASQSVDVAALLRKMDVQRRQFEADLRELECRNPGEWPGPLETGLEDTEATFGTAPTAAAVRDALGETEAHNAHAIDRYLLSWERDHGHRRDPEEARQDWFDAQPGAQSALMFLPIASSWDALVYLHWFGADRYPSADIIALGRSWQQRYGAELVAHYGTMLQCVVARPPLDLDEAWQLAREHDLLSPGTLAPSGTLLRHYAQGLVGYERWFLHERP